MTTSVLAKPASKRPRKMAREPECAFVTAIPKRTTKSDLIAAMLSKAGGASLEELITATGWLPHTTRAALTGLKKKGHTISSEKIEGVRRYRIDINAA
jgi:hypothetical protein